MLWWLVVNYHKLAIETLVLLLVWLLIAKERMKLERTVGELSARVDETDQRMIERFDTSAQQLNSVTQAVDNAIGEFDNRIALLASRTSGRETNGATGGDGGAIDRWNQIREIWQGVKERIEDKILDVSDGRIRKKYSRMNRYTYGPIIQTLAGDGLISNQTMAALSSMNATFLSLRSRPMSTLPEDLENFRYWHNQLGRSLQASRSLEVRSDVE